MTALVLQEVLIPPFFNLNPHSMYPYLSDILKDLFGIDLPFDIYSFGAMVALGALTAGALLGRELDRYYKEGRINGVKRRVEVDQKAEKPGNKNAKSKRKQRRKSEPSLRVVSPSYVVWTVTIIALVSGFVGAKVFHALENLQDFMVDPVAMLFSSGGFTFYGGLILATIFVIWYLRRENLSVPVFADALAPGLMLAYGIGRIGCHLAGDGDWGITSDLALKPDWLPGWFWAETYPKNIIYGQELAEAVYPTPIYEFLASALIFGILWGLRKHPFLSGWLFFLYLVFNGIERFLIEKIRVNNEFELLGLTLTQAEVISSVLILIGIVGLAKTTRMRSAEKSGENTTDRSEASEGSFAEENAAR